MPVSLPFLGRPTMSILAMLPSKMVRKLACSNYRKVEWNCYPRPPEIPRKTGGSRPDAEGTSGSINYKDTEILSIPIFGS